MASSKALLGVIQNRLALEVLMLNLAGTKNVFGSVSSHYANVATRSHCTLAREFCRCLTRCTAAVQM